MVFIEFLLPTLISEICLIGGKAGRLDYRIAAHRCPRLCVAAAVKSI
jgi:hypothetical protein